MLLTLPAITAEVPAGFDFGQGGSNTVRLALGMTECGLLRADDTASLAADQLTGNALRHLIETGWMREASALYQFKTLDCSATLMIPQGGDDLPWNPVSGDGAECAVMFNGGGNPEWIALKPVMERLEALRPGLGHTAMALVDWALTMGSEAFSPLGAIQMAQYLYWDGEEDEQSAREFRESQGEDGADIPTRSELFKGIPEWAYSSRQGGKPIKKLSVRQLAQCAKRFRKTPEAPLLDALSRLAAIYHQENHSHLPSWPEDYPCVEPMAVLAWGDEDELPRIYDDFWQTYAYGEQGPYTGLIAFTLTPEGIAEALARLRHTGLMLKALDDALTAIKEAQSP